MTSEYLLGAKVYENASAEVSSVEIIERNVVSISPFKYQKNNQFCYSSTQNIFCVLFKLLPVVLYGCENWSVIPREAFRLSVRK